MATGFSTFDPVSLKIVRDSYFVDEAAIEQRISALPAHP